MSELLLYPVLVSSSMVSFAFQNLVPAMLVRKVVWLRFNRRLMPKSANLAFPFMSGKQVKTIVILKNKLSFDKLNMETLN